MDRFREATRQSWDKNTRFHVDIREKVFFREAWRRRFARDRAAPIKPPREGAARGERDAPFPATRSSDSRATMPLGEFWIDLLSGWVGGAASVLAVQPVDTTLTRMQALRLAPGVDGSARAMFHRVVSEGGARALWRGTTPMTLVIPAQNALLFAGYGAGERWARSRADGSGASDTSASSSSSGAARSLNLLPVFVGGCFGGVAQSFIVSPFELVKIKQQSAGVGAASAAKEAAARLGSGVLWRGLGATLLRDGLPHGVWFVAYEWSKTALEERFPPKDVNGKPAAFAAATPLAAGAFAATAAWGVGYPFDAVKTRVQVAALQNPGSVPGLVETALAMVREGGGGLGGGLYRGFNMKLLRAVPASAVAFFAYEECRRWLELNKTPA